MKFALPETVIGKALVALAVLVVVGVIWLLTFLLEVRPVDSEKAGELVYHQFTIQLIPPGIVLEFTIDYQFYNHNYFAAEITKLDLDVLYNLNGSFVNIGSVTKENIPLPSQEQLNTKLNVKIIAASVDIITDISNKWGLSQDVELKFKGKAYVEALGFQTTKDIEQTDKQGAPILG